MLLLMACTPKALIVKDVRRACGPALVEYIPDNTYVLEPLDQVTRADDGHYFMAGQAEITRGSADEVYTSGPYTCELYQGRANATIDLR